MKTSKIKIAQVLAKFMPYLYHHVCSDHVKPDSPHCSGQTLSVGWIGLYQRCYTFCYTLDKCWTSPHPYIGNQRWLGILPAVCSRKGLTLRTTLALKNLGGSWGRPLTNLGQGWIYILFSVSSMNSWLIWTKCPLAWHYQI